MLPYFPPACRFLHVYTDEVYGSLGSDDAAFTETTAYAPNSPYSASKAASDHLVRAYFHTYGLPVVTTNCSNNYGPYQFPEKLIPLVIINALEDKPLPIYGDGKNIRDWLHVEDHCRGIEAVLNKGRLDELRPGEAPKSELITYVRDRAGHDHRYAIDATRIINETGSKPAYTFETGIEHTIHWYLDNQAWWERIRDGVYRDYYEKQYSV